MKVKMLEVFQGTGVKGKLIHDDIEVNIFQVGDEVEVSQDLGDWLLEHRKAEEIKSDYVPKETVAKEPKPVAEPVMVSKRGHNAKG